MTTIVSGGKRSRSSDLRSRIGYARVSTTDQKTDTQVERLKAAGCEVIRQEKVSGRSREGRSELETVLDFIRP